MSCSTDERPIDVTDILKRLKTAGSAEEFFAMLNVKYDPKVLSVCRLHILKRMGESVASEDYEGLPDRVIAARARATLQRAYDEFEHSSPLKQRVFKVLKDHDPERPVEPGAAFVSFDDILTPIKLG